MNELDNPTTTGMDGTDRDTWHTPQHETGGSLLLALAGAVAVLLLLALVAVQS